MNKMIANTNMGSIFVEHLLEWNVKQNQREMPWKGEKDPYKIWLSEIILQQTRVNQGLKYYENFIRQYPHIHSLANAPEEQVFKLWEGLGYYSRCRNLIETAKFISAELNGEFPGDYASILKLKGVGPYTAAAIASFAYNEPYAVLDGNVFRVLSRIFLIETPVDSIKGKNYFSSLSQQILPDDKAGIYNQAIMDFGAVICKPYPECADCFFNKNCKAYLAGRQDLLPVKEKKVKTRERWLNYFLTSYQDQVLIRQRVEKDIWQQLYEFPLIETRMHFDSNTLETLVAKQFGIRSFTVKNILITRQKLTHQVLNFSFFDIRLSQKKDIPGFFWVKKTELGKYPFPKSLQQFAFSG